MEFYVTTLPLDASTPYLVPAPRRGSSPPYIGDGLGFKITRRLQHCPFNLTCKAVRLEEFIIALFT